MGVGGEVGSKFAKATDGKLAQSSRCGHSALPLATGAARAGALPQPLPRRHRLPSPKLASRGIPGGRPGSVTGGRFTTSGAGAAGSADRLPERQRLRVARRSAAGRGAAGGAERRRRRARRAHNARPRGSAGPAARAAALRESRRRGRGGGARPSPPTPTHPARPGGESRSLTGHLTGTDASRCPGRDARRAERSAAAPGGGAERSGAGFKGPLPPPF